MAKLLDPLRSSEARGKVGGVIYNTTRGIKYAKVFTSPAQPRTARQLIIRAYMLTCTRAWASLTGAQRQSWNEWAALHPIIDWTGNPVSASGFNWYCALSVRLLDQAKTVVATPPSVNGPNTPVMLILTGGVGTLSWTFTPATGTGITIDMWTQGPMSAGRLGKLQHARHRIYAPGETSPVALASLTPGFYTAWTRFLSETDGQASSWEMASATVT